MSSQYNDTEDDLPLHPRSNRAEAYGNEERPAHAPEREVTLNTGVVLGIFFALAVLCAVFFGFGYSIGHKSAPPAVAAAEPDVTTTVETAAPAKPAAVPAQVVPEYIPSAGSKPSAAVNKPADVPAKPAPTVSAAPVRSPSPVRVESSPAAPTAAAPAATGTIYVQVAAVSHQEDADVLLKALQRKGYVVHPRSEAADQLIHVQVGPFATRKEADAMRQRLAGDGYNGFIK